MREAILHHIWKFKKFEGVHLLTTQNLPISILQVGQHNTDCSGPDFFNAKLEIDGQLWAGNVEIHIKSSDWYNHNHEKDVAYDNVILHVVWVDDAEVFRKDGSVIPTLQLRDIVSETLIEKAEYLLNTKVAKWIPCESQFPNVDDFILNNWLERLYVERLENKSQLIEKLLADSKQDWEAVLFQLLAKNFGLNVNGDYFLKMATQIPFSIIRKVSSNKFQMEALLLGQSNLLEDHDNHYAKRLLKEYAYLKTKFVFNDVGDSKPQFFRLRPPNFPTIRLSQLAALYSQEQNLFSKLIELKSVEDLYEVFEVTLDGFWETHYSFKAEHSKKNKTLTKPFKKLLIINTIVPLLFAYNRSRDNSNDYLLGWMRELPAEKNTIVKHFNKLKSDSITSALTSQGAIQLKRAYCEEFNCLQCKIGIVILK